MFWKDQQKALDQKQSPPCEEGRTDLGPPRPAEQNESFSSWAPSSQLQMDSEGTAQSRPGYPAHMEGWPGCFLAAFCSLPQFLLPLPLPLLGGALADGELWALGSGQSLPSGTGLTCQH